MNYTLIFLNIFKVTLLQAGVLENLCDSLYNLCFVIPDVEILKLYISINIKVLLCNLFHHDLYFQLKFVT